MNILGIEKSSFIDYPNKISTVIFTGGCNFRCPYCHNTSIVKQEGEAISEKEAMTFLIKRKKFIDAVCITGGEPTLQADLYEFIAAIKKEGFFVKLDTNGTRPHILTNLVDERLVDYVAMDIKAPFEQYAKVVDQRVEISSIESSIDILLNSNVDYEFRTTVCKELHTKADIINIATSIKGSKRFYLQNFRDGDTVLAGKKAFSPYDLYELELIRDEIKDLFDICEIRGK